MGARAVRAVGLAMLAVCSTAAPACAQAALEPGVHVDPGSPAAKEYQLALNQARQTGQPSPKSTGRNPSSGSSSSTGSGLFGGGITPKGGSGGGSSGGGSSASGASHARAPAHVRPTPAPRPRANTTPVPLPPAVLRATHSQSQTGGGSLLALIGGGLAILVLGGFGGTVLRHSRRPTPSR